MTRKNTIITLVSVIMLITATTILVSKKKHNTGSNEMLPVLLRTIKTGDGWGYEVLVNRKVYIHQDCIPAISTFKSFRSEQQALLIGNRVVDKIKHGYKPVITLQDISETHIQY